MKVLSVLAVMGAIALGYVLRPPATTQEAASDPHLPLAATETLVQTEGVTEIGIDGVEAPGTKEKDPNEILELGTSDQLTIAESDPDWGHTIKIRTEEDRPLAQLLATYQLSLRAHSLIRHRRTNPEDRYVAPAERMDLDQVLAKHQHVIKLLRAAIQNQRSKEMGELVAAGELSTAESLASPELRERLRAQAVAATKDGAGGMSAEDKYRNYLRSEVMARDGYTAFFTKGESGEAYLARPDDLPQTAALLGAGHMEHAIMEMAVDVLGWFVERGMMASGDRDEVLKEVEQVLKNKYDRIRGLIR